mmetsp:Transcript_11085/g.29539  ORF Transcript_11085/g.29539 Transcript_11085/m.29539 type:complete len:275 (-) Transcript_11085:196-1020(-)
MWSYKQRSLLLAVICIALAARQAHTAAICVLRREGEALAERQHLNEVSVRIFDERQPLHATRVRRLGEFSAHVLEPLACSIDIRDGDPNVAEAAFHGLSILAASAVGVTGVVHPVGVLRLRSMVPCELDTARHLHAIRKLVRIVLGDWAQVLLWRVPHEEHSESPLREVANGNKLHAKHLRVEIQRSLRVLHAEHGLLHDPILGGLVLGRRVVRAHVELPAQVGRPAGGRRGQGPPHRPSGAEGGGRGTGRREWPGTTRVEAPLRVRGRPRGWY